MGRQQTAEMRAKISAAMAGHKRKPLSPEHRLHLSESMHRSVISPDGHAALVESGRQQKGARRSAESRERMRLSHLGTGFGNDHARNAPVKGECVYCGSPGQTYDHVIPRGRSGWDDPDNVVAACFSCNRMKWNRTPEEWFTQDAR